MIQQRYTDEVRGNALAALAANGGNVKRTAQQLVIPRKTLADWGNGRVHPEVAKLAHQKKAELADKLEDIAHQLVDAIPAKLAAATLGQVAVALGIVIDKMLLLRRQATVTIEEELSDEERLRRLHELFGQVRRRLAQSDAGETNGPDNGGNGH